MIVYYTDGSSISQLYGGWAVVEKSKVLVAGSGYGTNNYMEMMAVMQAIAIAPPKQQLTIMTDSRLVIGWLAHNWKAHDRIAEIRIAIDMLRNSKEMEVKFVKIKGHAGHFGNMLADQAAYNEAEKFRKQETR